jgi:protein-tyrosine-phosphatase/DNA-binding transcriptional ArsR family regulator
MKKSEMVEAFAAIAQETRLDVLRLLAESGPAGMPAGAIGDRLRVPSPTLSFHLAQLRHAGLVSARRQSRLIIYNARFRTIDSLIEYLTRHCTNQPDSGSAAKPHADSRPEGALKVLFLCTHNSARSIMAECAMNRWGGGKFHAFSAGSRPRGSVHPITLSVLKQMNYETAGLRSKNWNEFAQAEKPPLDFVFTLCDRAAAEPCPAWPGQPIRAHWGVADPVAFAGGGAARRRAFLRVYNQLEQRIRIFTSLPIETLERFALERWVAEIGKLNLAA